MAASGSRVTKVLRLEAHGSIANKPPAHLPIYFSNFGNKKLLLAADKKNMKNRIFKETKSLDPLRRA